jgi:HK97 family phage portal protein
MLNRIRQKFSRAELDHPRRKEFKYKSDKAILVSKPLESSPGFDPRVNYDEYEWLYNISEDAQAHLETITYLVVGAGFQFIGDPKGVEKCEEFAAEIGFWDILENDVLTHLIFGNAYNFIVEEDNDFGLTLQVVHPKRVKIVTDEYGKIQFYWYDYNAAFVGEPENKFEPENVLHFRFRQFADNIYGLSLLHNVYNKLSLKNKIEATAAAMAHRDAHRLLWAKVEITPEDEAINPKTGKTYAEEKLEAVNELLSNRVQDNLDGTFTVSNNLVFDQTVTLNDLSSSHDFAGIAKILEHLQRQVDRALKVPKVFLGEAEGSNRATSYNQRRTFMLFIESIQRKFEAEINRKLIPKITDADVRLQFNSPLREDYSDWVEQAVKLYQAAIVTRSEARTWVDLPPEPPEEEE